MKRVLGLTGGVASGKSTVAKTLASLGAHLIDTDDIAREVVKPGTTAHQAICHHFGPDILLEGGAVNRRALRQIIIEQPQEKQWLETLLHPLIRQQVAHEVKNCNKKLCVVMIPLLYDRQAYPYLDEVWTVEAPQNVRLQRIIARDQVDKKSAAALIAAQPTAKARRRLADREIINDGSLEALKQKTKRLYEQIFQAAPEAK